MGERGVGVDGLGELEDDVDDVGERAGVVVGLGELEDEVDGVGERVGVVVGLGELEDEVDLRTLTAALGTGWLRAPTFVLTP